MRLIKCLLKCPLISFLFIILSFNLSYSHSGKLDKKGGHFVYKTWTSKQGLVFREGTYHYHDVKKQFGSVSISEDNGKRFLNIGSPANVNKVTVEIPSNLNKSDTEKFISETLDRYLGPFVVSKREMRKYKKVLSNG